MQIHGEKPKRERRGKPLDRKAALAAVLSGLPLADVALAAGSKAKSRAALSHAGAALVYRDPFLKRRIREADAALDEAYENAVAWIAQMFDGSYPATNLDKNTAFAQICRIKGLNRDKKELEVTFRSLPRISHLDGTVIDVDALPSGDTTYTPEEEAARLAILAEWSQPT